MSLNDEFTEIIKEIPTLSDGIMFVEREIDIGKKYDTIDEEIRLKIQILNNCVETPDNLEESEHLLNNFNDEKLVLIFDESISEFKFNKPFLNSRLTDWLKSKSNSVILTTDDKESTLFNLEVAKENLLKFKQIQISSEPVNLQADIEELKNISFDNTNVDKCIEGILKFGEKFAQIDFNEKLLEKKRDLEFEDSMKKLLTAIKQILQV